MIAWGLVSGELEFEEKKPESANKVWNANYVPPSKR